MASSYTHGRSRLDRKERMKLKGISWKETRARLRADYSRLCDLVRDSEGHRPPLMFCHPSLICVVLHRISSYFERAGHRLLARLLWHLNLLLTGADISELADLEGGLVILSPPGTAIMGRAGRNLTVMPCAGLGGEIGRYEDVGAGPGVPLLGDDVVLEPHCGVLGPVKVGSRVRVPAGLGVTNDVPDDACLEAPRMRLLPRRDL